jgi:hypothetical protein
MIKRPPSPAKLILDEGWLKRFCTYKQQRANLQWARKHDELRSYKIEKGEDMQNFITKYIEGQKKHSKPRRQKLERKYSKYC